MEISCSLLRSLTLSDFAPGISPEAGIDFIVAEAGLDLNLLMIAEYSIVSWGVAGKMAAAMSGINPDSLDAIDVIIGQWQALVASMPVLLDAKTSVTIQAPPAVEVPGGDTTPLMAMTDEEGNPILLSFGGTSRTANPSIRGRVLANINSSEMNANTTATALLAVCPLLMDCAPETKATILNECAASPDFPVLVNLIGQLLAHGYTDICDADEGLLHGHHGSDAGTVVEGDEFMAGNSPVEQLRRGRYLLCL